MARFTITRPMAATPAAVFAVLTDVDRLAPAVAGKA